jgi:hypothetical protein
MSNVLVPCGYCGTDTGIDTILAGMICCQDCLITEVNTFVQLRDSGLLEQMIAISPRTISAKTLEIAGRLKK